MTVTKVKLDMEKDLEGKNYQVKLLEEEKCRLSSECKDRSFRKREYEVRGGNVSISLYYFFTPFSSF